VFLAASCGQNENVEPESSAEEQEVDYGTLTETDDSPATATVLQTLGAFEGFVADIAAMEDPTLGFQGRILAANGPAGVQMISPEGRSLGSIPAPAPDAIAVSYMAGPGGPGIVLGYRADETASVLEATIPDGSAAATLIPPGQITTGPGVRDLCSVRSDVIAIDGRGDAWRITLPLAPSEDEAGVTGAQRLDGLSDVTGCYETPAGIIATGERGAQLILAEALEPVGIDPAAAEVVETEAGLVSIRLDDGVPVVDGNPVRILREDGRPLPIRMLRVIGGNFGGVLRNGLVLLLAEDNSLHTMAWSTLANAVGVNRQALTLRPLQVPGGEPVIEFDVPDAELSREELTQPRFEDREAPLPPSQGDG
jgi:hypothetical protein